MFDGESIQNVTYTSRFIDWTVVKKNFSDNIACIWTVNENSWQTQIQWDLYKKVWLSPLFETSKISQTLKYDSLQLQLGICAETRSMKNKMETSKLELRERQEKTEDRKS